MGEKKKNRAEDGNGRGGCCGMLMGCSVVLALLLSFLIGFWVIPRMRENDWSFAGVRIGIDDLRNKVSDKITDWNFRYVRAKDFVEETREKVEQTGDKALSEAKKTAKTAVKKTKGMVDSDILPGTEDTDFQPSLIED